MSYLVIARKWRPNLFEEIVGQEHVTRTLANAVAGGRTAHAYLFSGPRGVGKTTAARILAKCVNCASGPTAAPCNTCDICTSITSGSAVDVIEIDGASNTSVDNVRELRDNIRFAPAVCRRKVYIIDEVHMLSNAAFNALLKTLEEPPPHAIFIFATTEVHKIPRTILSRCQRFDFKRIPFREIRGHLAHIAEKEGIKISGGVLEIISREAEGSMRDAESLLDQVIAYAGLEITEKHVLDALGLMDRSLLFDLTESVLSGDGKTCLGIVEKAYTFGYDLKKVCAELIEHVRDMSVLKATGNASLLELPDAELKRVEKACAGVSDERLQMLFAILSAGYDDVSRSFSPRFSLEMALLRGARAGELRPISELIDALEDYTRGQGPIKTAPRAQVGSQPQVAQPQAAPLPKRELPWKAQAEARAAATKPDAEPEVAASEPQAAWKAAPVASPSVAEVRRSGADVAGFIDFITNEKKNRLLASALKNASAALDNDALSVSSGSSSKMLFDHRAEIEKYCLEFFKKEIKLSEAGVVAEPAAGQKPVKNAAPRPVESDTVVKEAIRILGGKVVEDSRRSDV